MSSTFYTSNNVAIRKSYQYVMTRLRNSCLITFRKSTKAVTAGTEAVTEGILKKGVLKNFANLTVKYLCWSLFLIRL